MTKINWTLADGKEVEIEVDDQVAEIEVKFQREQEQEHWRNKKRKAKGKDYVSLDYLKNMNIEIRDKSQDTFEQALAAVNAERLHKAIAKLSAPHQVLINKVFFQEKQLKDIAAEEGVTYQAIQNRLKKILQK